MISGNNTEPHQSHHLSPQLYCTNLFSAVCTGDIDLFVQSVLRKKRSYRSYVHSRSKFLLQVYRPLNNAKGNISDSKENCGLEMECGETSCLC